MKAGQFNSIVEVKQLAKKTFRNLVVFQENVYDITNFMKLHPGG